MAPALHLGVDAMPSSLLLRAFGFGIVQTLVLATAFPRPARAEPARTLTVTGLDEEPSRAKPTAESSFDELRKAIASDPKLRKPRFDLVHALVRAGRLDEAHAEATAWREHDAYSLVAVRQLGDIEAAQGDRARARRTYSSIVELLPKDVEARRALATVLKQAGDLEGARAQLNEAAALRPDDKRTAFELGDVEARMGLEPEARAKFEATAKADDAPESLRYPARQRLSQIVAADRRRALQAGDAKRVQELSDVLGTLGIHGGVANDLKIYLTWDSDRTDVDLWVTSPSGEKVFFSHRKGARGEELFDDVTTGYGPESYTAHEADPGDYLVQVNFFGASGAFKEARGEVVVVSDEGGPSETRHVFPYRMFDVKETVNVAKIHVEASAKGGAR
ncbi:MAG: tetratricopeptide repeat protein [Polyangiaceae bacterium]